MPNSYDPFRLVYCGGIFCADKLETCGFFAPCSLPCENTTSGDQDYKAPIVVRHLPVSVSRKMGGVNGTRRHHNPARYY